MVRPGSWITSSPKEKDVDIDEARPFGLKALASLGAFDLKQTLQECLRREVGFQQHHTVEEPGLIEKIDRLGFVKRRNGGDGSERVQASDGIAQDSPRDCRGSSRGKGRRRFAFHVSCFAKNDSGYDDRASSAERARSDSRKTET